MNTSNEKRIAFIDGDLILYSSAYATSSCESALEALKHAENSVYSTLLASGCTHYQGFLTSKANFRYDKAVTAPYKAGRKKEKPIWFIDILQYLTEVWQFITVHGFEADDLIASQAKKYKEEAIVCSYDKDLLQIPGKHYNSYKNTQYKISEYQARYHLSLQLLTGDSTDNIKGLVKIGPIRAKKMLEGSEDPIARAFKLYLDHFGTSKGIYRFTENYTLLSLVDDIEVKEEPLKTPINTDCSDAAIIST